MSSKDTGYQYLAKVAELPGYETTKKYTINKAIKEVKEYINDICLYHDRNCIEKGIYWIIYLFTKILGFIFGNDPDIVFSHSTKDENDKIDNYFYIYTFNDKRNNHTYTIKRLITFIFIVLLIYFISCYMDFGDIDISFKKYSLSTLKYSVSILSILTTIWAVQSYWRLRYIDEEDRKWQPHNKSSTTDGAEAKAEVEDQWSSPFSFHVLAESHKQWAELWFSWCVAIFVDGVTYAIFKVIDHNNQYQKIIGFNITNNSNISLRPFLTLNDNINSIPTIPWSTVVHDLISGQAPSSFIYLLFGVAWYWSSKHYRSHWHNFVINAYRHRALYRLEQLRNNIRDSKKYHVLSNHNNKADETILELYRLSGVLLLIPGDSSYLDKVGSEEITKTLLQMEEIAKAFTNKTANP